jgi:hypothetical protein
VLKLCLQTELWEQEQGGDGVRIVESFPAHYEVQEVEDLGRVYRWCPEKVIVECDECETRITFKRSNLITSIIACECGAKSTASVREELLQQRLAEDNDIHPWRHWHSNEDAGIPV